MTGSIAEYDKVFDRAILESENLLGLIKREIVDMDEDDMVLSDNNYDRTIFNLERTVTTLETQKYQYRFSKMGREEFDVVLKNTAEGKPSQVIKVGMPYKVRSIDTLQLISRLFGVDAYSILEYNGIDSKRFEDIKEINGEIKIPTFIDLGNRKDYSELPVFGSIEGNKAWGIDLPNEIEYENGDLTVLDELETLKQGIKNIYGEFGDIPLYEDEIITLPWGEDFPKEMVNGMLSAQLSQKLLDDKRIKEVTRVDVQDARNGKIAIVEIVPINTKEEIEERIPL